MMKSRFAKELSGELGEFWQKRANESLVKIKSELESGQITIDENGVAYNCIGRVVVSDVLEMLTYVTDRVNVEATKKASDEETSRWAAEYRKAMANHVPDEEEIAEMRAAFGAGATVVDVITGKQIQL